MGNGRSWMRGMGAVVKRAVVVRSQLTRPQAVWPRVLVALLAITVAALPPLVARAQAPAAEQPPAQEPAPEVPTAGEPAPADRPQQPAPPSDRVRVAPEKMPTAPATRPAGEPGVRRAEDVRIERTVPLYVGESRLIDAPW